jgi:hypothetical protein
MMMREKERTGKVGFFNNSPLVVCVTVCVSPGAAAIQPTEQTSPTTFVLFFGEPFLLPVAHTATSNGQFFN